MKIGAIISRMKTIAAPIPEAAVRESLRPFGQSRMLPRAAYVEPAVLAWELKHLFAGGWVCVGRSDKLPQPGSQAAVRSGDLDVLITRDTEGRLHAFENICRHRGHELLACGATAQCNNVLCPYHAWSYGLDGSLRHARAIEGIANARREDLSLLPVRLAEWGGWIFVNTSADARPFDAYIGDLATMFTHWEIDRLVVGARHDYELKANWKVAIENYHECYHCSMIHPALCKVSPPDSGGIYYNEAGAYTGGWMTLADHAQTMSFDGASKAEPFRRLTAEQRREVHYVCLFPGLLISLHPDFVMTHRLEPITPTTTHVECEWLFAPEALQRPGFDAGFAVSFWDKTNREDWAAVESVQRGLASDRFVPGILSSDEESVYHFVRLVAQAYLGESQRLARS
jgi:glycine betaine catabolism A